MKKYVIRKSAYAYSDEFYYEMVLGAITHTFDDRDQAYAKLTELEVPNFRQFDMGDIKELSRFGRAYQFQDQRRALETYLSETLNYKIFLQSESTGNLYVERNTYLPHILTEEQIMKIRELSGIRFHELSVFEDEIKFYAIWLPLLNKFHQVDYGDAKDAIYFFNSYDEALQYIGEIDLEWRLRDHKPLHGTLAELSYQPEMLKSFIDTTEHISYDDEEQEIKTTYHFGIDGAYAGLNALLKTPLFEIRDFPYEQAKLVPHAPFEYM